MNYTKNKNIASVIEKALLSNGEIVSLSSSKIKYYLDNCSIFPGFADVHVHLREPGFIYKETIRTGTMAAARGGYTDVCSMPNLDPVPDSFDNLFIQLKAIKNSAVIGVHPYASLTVGEKGETLSDMETVSSFCVGFSDDGKGVQRENMMRQAMLTAKKLGKVIAAHCEDESLLNGGYIHDGIYARTHGYAGICSESEWGPVMRDIELARETGCSYHVCHVSAKETVELVRKAKREGVDITCETAPHYLLFNDEMLEDSGKFKMNPPIRGEEDRLALIEGIKDGTIDMIATDHAPHSAEEKSKGLKGSMMGVSGLEAAFPVLYTGLVKTGIITIEKLLSLMCHNPRKRFDLPCGENDFSVWDLDREYGIESKEFLSMGKSTPFDGKRVFGKCVMTIYGGKVVWSENLTEK